VTAVSILLTVFSLSNMNRKEICRDLSAKLIEESKLLKDIIL
jgi:hypothetical protein